MKIKIKDEIVELSTSCYWEVRNGVLYNLNTGKDEGVDGDIVEYKWGSAKYRGHVKGYTCGQFVVTEEWGRAILSADELYPIFTHITPVEIVEEDEDIIH